MFSPDVIALKEFYASPTGASVRRAIALAVASLWPELPPEPVMGLGFAAPYLEGLYVPTASKTTAPPLRFACMPATLGVLHWPGGERNRACLAHEAELPFASNSLARILVVHGLENSEQTRPMLAELWRVMAPTGRVLIVAPNRRGIWARAGGSPFACGQPFTPWQLRQLLSDHSFTPLHARAALFFPPFARPKGRGLKLWERLGNYFCPGFGGVVVMEAEKQIYARVPQQARSTRKPGYYPLAQPV